MIEYVKGALIELTPTDAIVETAGGVAYSLSITLPTYTGLEAALATHATVKLLCHEVIREDAWLLYGFAEERERALFRLLIGVSGVGASTARIMLSSIPVAELEQVIVAGDTRRLKAVKGIGAKTAERVIVDLKDKVHPSDDAATLLPMAAANSEVFEEALAALVMLGFPKPASQKVLKKLFEAEPSIKVESAIRKSLAML
ncbi:Holliday junction branch migration protein RuvA [Muribaculum sp.]|uniref:Holliday junction branch migration protein RuvA n=1 Tax=Muribaculum sp. TaxID=1918611 RepID=UPI0023BD2F7F|nr:Holliday junction branch migration protein RuvA [Muribaculum sp.]MDE5705594.1 Holliday junction branch migration protein RuvA [Muribaculum sp.]